MVKPGGPAEHLAKSAEFLAAVRLLLAAGLSDRAASDAYFAAFHAAQALLATAGLGAETHAGVHTLLARHFVEDGPLPPGLPRALSHLLTDRLMADYAVASSMTAADGADAVASAARIIAAVIDALVARAPEQAAAAGQVRAALAGLPPG